MASSYLRPKIIQSNKFKLTDKNGAQKRQKGYSRADRHCKRKNGIQPGEYAVHSEEEIVEKTKLECKKY